MPEFARPDVEAPLIVWEYVMTLERWVLNAEERVQTAAAALVEIHKLADDAVHGNAIRFSVCARIRTLARETLAGMRRA